MYFMRTLEEWSRFDINNRTQFDASISSGLAVMANQKEKPVFARTKTNQNKS